MVALLNKTAAKWLTGSLTHSVHACDEGMTYFLGWMEQEGMRFSHATQSL
jgi:hypothetical protein